MKTLVNRDLDLTFSADTDAAALLAEMKAADVKIGKTSLAELLSGKRDVVCGFTLIDSDVVDAVIAALPANPVLEEQKANLVLVVDAPAPRAADADKTPGFTEDAVGAAVMAAILNPPAPVDKPAAAPKAARVHTPRAKAVIKAMEPKGKVKPVRKGTKIALGLEMLLAGADEASLTTAALSDDIVDFVNRRVTKRGYGVALIDGLIKLVLPADVPAIVYGGKADAPEAE